MIRNQAGQSIGAQMISATTGAAFTGTVTAYVTIDAGVQAIGTVGAGVCTHEGNGYHTYRPSQAETDGELIAFTFIGTGAIPQTVQVPTVTPAQQTALATAVGVYAVPILTIITDAFQALNIYGATELPSPEDTEFARGKLNTIFDDWNAERGAVYADQFITGAFTPALDPHTIGPTGTFVVNQRPVTIDSASWLNGGFYTPIDVHMDADRYDSLSNPSLAGVPSEVYYNPTWPNGSLYFYPVPSTAYSLILTTRVVLGQVLLSDIFSMPPGYRSAVTLTLQEALVPAYPGSQTTDLARDAGKARARAFGNNTRVPRLRTQDSGMPSGRSNSGYDYRSGGWNGWS